MTSTQSRRADASGSALASHRSAVRHVGGTAIVKVGAMGVAGLAGMITSRLIIGHHGVDAFAQYGLLATLPSLLPFADLGVAAVLVNVIASSRDPLRDEQVRRTIVSAFRILLVSASVIALGSAVVGLAGWWPALLGEGLMGREGALAATLCGLVFALALPLGVGQRLLVSSGRTALQTGLSALGSPLVLGLVALSTVLAWRVGPYVAVFSYLANAVVALLCLVVAARGLSPQVTTAMRQVPQLRRVPGVRVIDVAWPMLLQMVALPIAMQTGRLLLSHRAGSQEIAEFTLGSQLFNLIVQLVAAAGMALWPLYARARAQGQRRSPLTATWIFLAGGLALALAMWAALPLLTHVISDGAITLDTTTALAFVVFVALQAMKYPMGMYMTDAAGLRFQVLPILAMIPLSLGLSFVLIPELGAAAPIIATAAAVLLCQVLPNAWFVRRDLARNARAEQSASGERTGDGVADGERS